MKTKMTKMLSCCFLVAGGLMMAGCSTDDGIDVGEVDTLLGVGTNGFTIPGGGSDPIQLINIFKIDDSDCIDTIFGGNYRFYKDDDGIDATAVKIDPVSVDLDANKIQTYKFVVPIASTHNAREVNMRRAIYNFNKTITTFDFTENNLTGAIRELQNAEIDPVHNEVRVKMNGEGEVSMPVTNGKIHITDIKTGSDLIITGNIVAMDFTKAKKTFGTDIQELKFNASTNFKQDLAQVIIKGLVFIDVKYDENDLADDIITQIIGKSDDDFYISSVFTLGEGYKPKMEFRDVTGRFFPDIDLSIDPVKITDIPDFLTKDGVNIDLADLFLELGVTSTMPLPGTVNVKMTPIIDKYKKASIVVNGIKINKNSKSKVLISRKDNRASKSGYTDYHWKGDADGSGDIGNLLTNIPDEIEFDCDAKADSANFYKV